MRHKIQPLRVNEKLTVFYYYGTLENIHIRTNIKKRDSYKHKTTQLQDRTDRKNTYNKRKHKKRKKSDVITNVRNHHNNTQHRALTYRVEKNNYVKLFLHTSLSQHYCGNKKYRTTRYNSLLQL